MNMVTDTQGTTPVPKMLTNEGLIEEPQMLQSSVMKKKKKKKTEKIIQSFY